LSFLSTAKEGGTHGITRAKNAKDNTRMTGPFLVSSFPNSVLRFLVPFLVPKQSLGTPSAKLRFPFLSPSVGGQTAKRSFARTISKQSFKASGNADA
jgi:hypothetical protein